MRDFGFLPPRLRAVPGNRSACSTQFALGSRMVVKSPAVNASNMAVASPKNSMRISSRLACPRNEGQIAAPIVGIARQHDRAPGLEPVDDIGRGARSE